MNATCNTKKRGTLLQQSRNTGPRSREDALSPNLADCTRSATPPRADVDETTADQQSQHLPNLFRACGKTKRDETMENQGTEIHPKPSLDFCNLNMCGTVDSNLSPFFLMTFGDRNNELFVAVFEPRSTHNSTKDRRKYPWAPVVFKRFARHFC